MVEGRRRNFDLAAFGGKPVLRKHGSEQFELLGAKGFFIVLGKSTSLPRELRHDGIFREIFFVHPGELREHLQIAPILENEMRDASFRACRQNLRAQFLEPRPAVKEVIVELKSTDEGLALLFRGERTGVSKRNLEPRFPELAAGVLLDLRGERRNKIEGRVNSGKLAKNSYHSPVIFEGVQARPGKQVLASGGIAILRLVHVPENDEIDAAHPSNPSALAHSQ